MAHVPSVSLPDVHRAGTAAIVAAVIGAGAAVGIVALTGDLESQNASAPVQSLPEGAAFVQPAPSTPALSAQATAALRHTPR
jgi:hypothetical protein